MHLPTKVPKKFWSLLIALWVVFLAIGAYGWHRTLEIAHRKPQWELVVDQTIHLAKGENFKVVGAVHDEHWSLSISRAGIKAVIAAAFMQSIFWIFRRQLRQFAFRKARGHVVFAGFGMNNPDLALAASAKGQKVAIIGNDAQHPRLGELEQAGILFVAGSPVDPLKLKAAGVERSAQVVVAADCGDNETISSAETIAAMARPESLNGNEGQILVCIESLEIRELLNQRWKLVVHPSTWQARVVSFEAAALRHIVGDAARDLALVPDIAARGVRILVVADEFFSRDFLRVAIAFIQITGSRLPEYVVAVRDPKMEKAFRTLHPALDLVAKVEFIQEDDFLVPASPALAGQNFDLAVVKLADETSTLELADKVLCSPQFNAQRVRAIVLHPPKTQLIDEPRLKIDSIFEMGLKSPEFGDLELERQARENHAAYLAGLSPEERAKAQEYDALGEAFKESNRWAVLHRQIKKTIWDAAPESARAGLVEHLAICEHQRWMAEKVMNGWRGGKPRDNARRIHPDIAPFMELSEAVKEKDRVQVRKGLGL